MSYNNSSEAGASSRTSYYPLLNYEFISKELN